MDLPEPVRVAVQPVFDRLPLDEAMAALVVASEPDDALVALVADVARDPAVAARPPLVAGLWLYVDALEQSHGVSQGIKDPTGSFWHGIMHRREGDFGNSHYWFHKTGSHPAMAAIPDYDPHAFIDAVAARHRESPADLQALQRAEWQALFAWCARS